MKKISMFLMIVFCVLNLIACGKNGDERRQKVEEAVQSIKEKIVNAMDGKDQADKAAGSYTAPKQNNINYIPAPSGAD